MEAPLTYVPHRRLKEFIAALFGAAGLPIDAAETVSDCLIAANLRGVDSHGVARVPIYLRRLRAGLVNPEPDVKVERRSGGVSVVDGDNGVGPVVGMAAVEEAIRLAGESGVGAVTARNSNHYGIAAYYLRPVLEGARIGLTVTNAPATMAPAGGYQPFFGTNPWAIAAPAGKYRPVVLDMATSVVARGKVSLAEQRGEPIPEGWALDPQGRPTTDPSAALAGAVLPFAGPKGSGLAMFADIFAGVLSGAAFATQLGDLYRNLESPQNLGHFFLVLDIESVMPATEFARRMEWLVEAMRSGGTAEGSDAIRLPGEIEDRYEQERSASGLPLTPDVVEALNREAELAGVAMPELSTEPFDQTASTPMRPPQ